MKNLYIIGMSLFGLPVLLAMLNLMLYMISGYSLMGEFDEARLSLFIFYTLTWAMGVVFLPLILLDD